jgi:anti-sigma regulatory factor (Ser/Thr protein kinase)
MSIQTPLPESGCEFAMEFTSTLRGARLARKLVSRRLDDWGHPYGGGVNDTVTLIGGELAANAVRHGHVAGRGFHLRLAMTPEVIRIEVSDTRTERQPVFPAVIPDPDAESGRGLLLVAQLADRWAVAPRPGAPGKTVWAEVIVHAVPCGGALLGVDDGGGDQRHYARSCQ